MARIALCGGNIAQANSDTYRLSTCCQNMIDDSPGSDIGWTADCTSTCTLYSAGKAPCFSVVAAHACTSHPSHVGDSAAVEVEESTTRVSHAARVLLQERRYGVDNAVVLPP